MLLVSRTLALVLLALSASAAHAQTDTLVGSWEMVVPSDLPTAADTAEIAEARPVITFGADGALTFRLAGSSDTLEAPPPGTYSVQGDTLIGLVDGQAQPARFWFKKRDLFIDDGTDVIQFRRVSGC